MALKESRLTWTDGPTGGSAITGYRILLIADGQDPQVLTSDTADLLVEHLVDSDRTAIIQARNAQGLSAPLSITIPAAPEVVPVDPTKVAAQVTLTATGGNYDYLHWIRIQYDLAPRGTVSPFVDTNIANGLEYSYHAMVSLNGSAEISSNVVTVTPSEITFPTFTAVRDNADPRKVVITLTSTPDPKITGYVLYIGNQSFYSADTTFPRTYENLPTDEIKVFLRCNYKASNGANGFADSPKVTVAAYKPGDVGTPPVIAAEALNAGALLTVTTPGTNTYYRVKVTRASDNADYGAQFSQQSLLDAGVVYSGLENEQTYNITVYATDKADVASVAGNTVTVTPSATGTPSAPEIDAAVGDQSVTITETVAGGNYDSLTAYLYDATVNPDQPTLIPNVTLPYTYSNLINGDDYVVAILAIYKGATVAYNFANGGSPVVPGSGAGGDPAPDPGGDAS
jgi:hypothetical protein